MTKPNIICLTPIKNESWILDRFLKCASLWADYIIIADQQSNDGSREIVYRYPKVKLIDNSSTSFNEPERQALLINTAREIPEPRLLVALDADEFLTANFMTSPEWAAALEAPRGTIIRFQRSELLPSLSACWLPAIHFPYAFMDDGSPHIGQKIHSPRVPTPPSAPTITLKTIKVLLPVRSFLSEVSQLG